MLALETRPDSPGVSGTPPRTSKDGDRIWTFSAKEGTSRVKVACSEQAPQEHGRDRVQAIWKCRRRVRLESAGSDALLAYEENFQMTSETSAGELSETGPGLHALPRSKPLRFRFSGLRGDRPVVELYVDPAGFSGR